MCSYYWEDPRFAESLRYIEGLLIRSDPSHYGGFPSYTGKTAEGQEKSPNHDDFFLPSCFSQAVFQKVRSTGSNALWFNTGMGPKTESFISAVFSSLCIGV